MILQNFTDSEKLLLLNYSDVGLIQFANRLNDFILENFATNPEILSKRIHRLMKNDGFKIYGRGF